MLAFDDKRHVPRAKAITQLKRRAGVNMLPFGEADILPNALPVEWKEAIMSPWFKHRVIELVCANVPRLVTPPAGARLIVDWETVVEYTYSGQVVETPLEMDSDIGEADLKFTRWARRLRCSMLIEATDGDYIPISLGLMAAGFDWPIVILKAWTEERGLEFISMDGLSAFLHRRFRIKGKSRPDAPWWEVKLFIVLLGLCGTDFTRNLPLVSPTKMWAALPLMVQTFEMESDTRIDMAQGKRMVEILYAEAFPKHIDVFSRRSVWHQAQVLRSLGCGGLVLSLMRGRPPNSGSATRP